MSKVDLLIVGQGIAGTVLAYQAIQRGYRVKVINKALPGRATQVAGGLFNPVTGRRIKKSWNYDLFFPDMIKTYQGIEKLLRIKVLHLLPIYRLLSTAEDVNNWEIQRLEEEYKPYMQSMSQISDVRIKKHAGVGVLNQGGWLDTSKLLKEFQAFLIDKEAYLEDIFNYQSLEDNRYREIQFDKIAFCEGFRISENPFFQDIHLWPTKGETLIIEMPGEDLNYILTKHIALIPLGDGKYKVGATLEREIDFDPSEKGCLDLKEKLDSMLQSPYRVINQDAGIRPNVRDRRPLLGCSKQMANWYIFNGLGSKGVLLAPYFATELLDCMWNKKELTTEVNWQRIYKKLRT